MKRYSALALVLLVASSASAAEKSFERTFTVAPDGLLTVDVDAASVDVSGVDTNKVTVRITASGSDEDLANTKMDAIQKDDGVTVTVRREMSWSWFKPSSWHSDGHVHVTVPQHYRVNVHTSGGGVQLAETIGSATLKTSGGDIVAKNVTGNVEVRTSGGGILADSIRGDVDANTSGGDIRLLLVDGKIKGQTSGGNVQCSLVGVNRGISASTSGGDIQLTLPRNTAANLEARTSGGDIKIDIPVTSTDWKEDHVNGSINGGGPVIDAHTSGGSISLRAAN